jgi:hypothetical protein
MSRYSTIGNIKVVEGAIEDSDINMSGGIIINHEDPINPTDVANKRYVDNMGGGSGIGGTVINNVLTGTTWYNIILDTEAPRGIITLHIIYTGGDGGPMATFTIIRSKQNIDGTVSYGYRVKGETTGEFLEVRWLNGSGVDIRKTNNGYNGMYKILANLVVP